MVSCIVSWLHFVYGAAINRRSSVMHRAPFSAWQGVMVPHVMWCVGIGPTQLMMLPRGPVPIDGAASRPYSINAAVWTAFVAVNGVCMHSLRQDLFLKIQETRHAIV